VQIAAGRFDVEPTNDLSSQVFPFLYLNTQRNIRNEYGLPAGNLFVRRNVFDHLGLFPIHSNSGGDITWTRKAISMGYKLHYIENSRVIYPPKPFPDLLKDVIKYGAGAVRNRQKKWYELILYVMPLRLKTMNDLLHFRKLSFSWHEKIRMWMMVWWVKIHFAYGMAKALLKSPFSKPSSPQ
jgi:hypothetical protein